MYKSDKLIDKWRPLLEHESLGSIKDPYKRAVTAVLLENQEKQNKKDNSGGYAVIDREDLQEQFLAENPANTVGASPNSFPSNPNLQGYDPVLISLVRRAMPNLIAFDVLGVQPMQGPTGLIFALRSKYTSQGGAEALFNEANTNFSGSAVPAQAGVDPLPQALATDYIAGTGLATSDGEGLGYPGNDDFAEMALSIEKVTVEAKTRALKAEYSMEIAQDLKAIHGLDAETELANILSAEILAEINREVVRTIYNNAVPGAQHNVTNAGVFDLDVDSNGRWSVEKFKGLMFQIERDANAIAKATRRGRGNILITSSDVASALSITGLLDTAPALKDNLQVDDTGNTFVGILNGRFKVFIDHYVPASNSNYYVVGYRGSNSYDAGLFYCPYVPLQMVRAVGQDTFQPKIGFKTRYGLVSNPFATAAGDGATGQSAWNQNVYYRKVLVQNLM
jgi:hypothetical protein